jgi:hypothetical protein
MKNALTQAKEVKLTNYNALQSTSGKTKKEKKKHSLNRRRPKNWQKEDDDRKRDHTRKHDD